LGHAHEGDLPLVETLHHPREVQEAAAEAVDFVHDHCLDKTGVDVGQQALQGRAFHVAAGEAAVVVARFQAGPALALLAGHIGFAGLALGVQTVELLLQAFFGGLAGVDGAAHQRRPTLLGDLVHAAVGVVIGSPRLWGEVCVNSCGH